MSQEDQKCVPCPEIISRAVGDVSEDQMGSLVTGEKLNRDDLRTSWDESGRGNRRHIFGHLMWSPKEMGNGIRDRGLTRALEDARVNLGLKEIGMQVKCDESHDDMLKSIRYGEYCTDYDFTLGSICVEIASIGTDAELTGKHQYGGIQEAVKAVKKFIKVNSKGPVTTFFELTKLKTQIKKMFDGPVWSFDHDGRHIHPLFVSKSTESKRMKQWVYVLAGKSAEKVNSDMPIPAGEMFINSPRLNIKVLSDKSPTIDLKKSAHEEGCVPVRMDRYLVDQKIFQRKRKKKAKSTVLVDVSGSMDLSLESIKNIVLESSALATVAIYSAGYQEGELRIVAHKGKMTDDIEPYGQCNVIDLPALEWLAKQPGPRVWISDGQVTGIDDGQCTEMIDACREVVEKGDITMVRTVGSAIELLSR